MNNNKILIIAEVGQAHDGSLGLAHSFIDALSDTGVDIVKFQTHVADAESSEYESFRINFSYEDVTRYDYWKRMEFTLEQWKGLADHCTEVGLEFMSTPSCLAAVDLLEKLDVKRYKVGSGDISNKLLLQKLALTNKPVIISTGMSTIDEIQHALNVFPNPKKTISLLQCTSKYPTQPSDIGLNFINEYQSIFDCPIGFSDHSGTIYPCLAAAALGCAIVEFHIVFDKKMFGPDSTSSLTIKEVQQLVKGIRYISDANNNQVAKGTQNHIKHMKSIFGKSLAVNKDLKKGHIITFDDLESKKPPGYGINAELYERVLGRELIKSKIMYDYLNYEDLKN